MQPTRRETTVSGTDRWRSQGHPDQFEDQLRAGIRSAVQAKLAEHGADLTITDAQIEAAIEGEMRSSSIQERPARTRATKSDRLRFRVRAMLALSS